MPGHRPNILVVRGDHIGITDLSCDGDGLMGHRTPDIDRIAAEGTRFADADGEQSCTAGRAAFITGQSVDTPDGPARARDEDAAATDPRRTARRPSTPA